MKRHPQRGFSMLELMITAAISSVVVLAYVTYSRLSLKNTGQAAIRNTIENYRGNFRQIVIDPDAFYNTVKRNAAIAGDPAQMSCLWSMVCDSTKEAPSACPAPTTCPNGKPAPANGLFNLYGAEANRLIYDSITASSGINLQGTVCNTFDGTNGNDECPFRFEFRWTAECAQAQCSCLSVRVEGRLKAKFKGDTSAGQFNANLGSMDEFQRGFPEQRIAVSQGQKAQPQFVIQLLDPVGNSVAPISVPNAGLGGTDQLYEIWRRATPSYGQASTAQISLTRSASGGNPNNVCNGLQVNYEILSSSDSPDPTAQQGLDFTFTNATLGSVFIPPGKNSISSPFTIVPLLTSDVADNKQVILHLLPGNGYTLSSNAADNLKTIVIRDNYPVATTNSWPLSQAADLGFNLTSSPTRIATGGSVTLQASSAFDLDASQNPGPINIGLTSPAVYSFQTTHAQFGEFQGNNEVGGGARNGLQYSWVLTGTGKHCYCTDPPVCTPALLACPGAAPAFSDLSETGGGPNWGTTAGVGSGKNRHVSNSNNISVTPQVDGYYKLQVIASDGNSPLSPILYATPLPVPPAPAPGVYSISASTSFDAYAVTGPPGLRKGGSFPVGPGFYYNTASIGGAGIVDFTDFYEVSGDGRASVRPNFTLNYALSTFTGGWISGQFGPAKNQYPGATYFQIPSSFGAVPPAPLFQYSQSSAFTGPKSVTVVVDDGLNPVNSRTDTFNLNLIPYGVSFSVAGTPKATQSFTLNGSYTDDDSYPTTSFSWSASPPGLTFTSPNSQNTTAISAVSNTYTVTFTFSDGAAPPISVSQNVFVDVPPVNQLPTVWIAGVTSPQTVGIPFTLTGGWLDLDGYPGPYSYNWSGAGLTIVSSGGVSGSPSNSVNATFTASAGGTYTVTFQVDDGSGTPVTKTSPPITVNSGPFIDYCSLPVGTACTGGTALGGFYCNLIDCVCNDGYQMCLDCVSGGVLTTGPGVTRRKISGLAHCP